jgi:DNA-binding CsgD family transcriptional regulator
VSRRCLPCSTRDTLSHPRGDAGLMPTACRICYVEGAWQSRKRSLNEACATLLLWQVHVGSGSCRRQQQRQVGILMPTMWATCSVPHYELGHVATYSRGRGDETLRALRVVARGEAIYSPAIAERLIQFFTAMTPNRGAQALPDLSPREWEMLTLLARRHTNTAVAERRVSSPKTVRNPVSNIFSTLQVAHRAQATIQAGDAGTGCGPGQRWLNRPLWLELPQWVDLRRARVDGGSLHTAVSTAE